MHSNSNSKRKLRDIVDIIAVNKQSRIILLKISVRIELFVNIKTWQTDGSLLLQLADCLHIVSVYIQT